MKPLLALAFLLFPCFPGAFAQGTESVELLLDSAWDAYDLQDYEKMKDLAGDALVLAEKRGK